MAVVTPSIDVFLFSAFISLVSWLYLSSTLAPSNKGSKALNDQRSTNHAQAHLLTRKLLSIFIALHIVYMLYKIIVQPPKNLFALLRLPLNVPSDSIRQLLLRKGRTEVLPRSLDVLLTRFQSFEARVAYVRFGHSVVQDCEHCETPDDFALYALPSPILEYVRMAVVVGMVTIRGSGRERWRQLAFSLVTAAAAAELYFVLTAEISFSPEAKQTLMVHDAALHLRRALFLLLPPALYLIPPRRSPSSPLQALPDLVARVEQIRARLQLLRLTSAARSRHPDLRNAADEWWAIQRKDGQCAVNDRALQEMAEKLAINVEGNNKDGQRAGLRGRAKIAVEALQLRFSPLRTEEKL